MSPTILLVPGYWEGPSVYGEVDKLLQDAGYATETAPLISTGRTPPNSPTMDDDTASIREHVSKLVEAGKDVILVVHSVSGLMGSNAIEGLEASKRKADGSTGGVTHIVFLAAGIAPEGFEHTPPAFIQDNVSEPTRPECLSIK
jgi:pimeloyl-ACP methyl ester carboxylesterase